MLQLDQAYYWRFKCKTCKHYTYLQSIFNQKLLTKDIKNAKQQGLGLGNHILQNKGGGVKRCESKFKVAK